jgi:hypothetical protein
MIGQCSLSPRQGCARCKHLSHPRLAPFRFEAAGSHSLGKPGECSAAPQVGLRVEKVEGEVGGSFSGVRYAAAFVALCFRVFDRASSCLPNKS